MPVNIDYLSENSPQSPYFIDFSRCADSHCAEIQPMPLLTHIERRERESKCTKHTNNSCTYTQLSHQSRVYPIQTKPTFRNPNKHAENRLKRLSRLWWYQNTLGGEIIEICPLRMLLRMVLNRVWFQAKCMVNSLVFSLVMPDHSSTGNSIMDSLEGARWQASTKC